MAPKRRKDKTLIFKDYPDFRPNLTPREMFELGSFGGTYWRPIRSSITKKRYKDAHKEFPKSWWKNVPDAFLTSSKCDARANQYGVKVGTSLEFWEKKGWIKAQDPYGWVQWYCRFYQGRRTKDDERQIKRWLGIAGPKGRFRKWLVTLILKEKGLMNRGSWNDVKISPKIRQTLQHWAYRLTKKDFDTEVKSRKKKT